MNPTTVATNCRRSSTVLKHLDALARRLVDISAAAAGLILFSPLLLILAVAVKLSSPGPVFFSQTRVGKHGREFKLFKLRTMICSDGPEVTAANDTRITKLGRLLRKYKLDELPQLFNVLLGHMSLVGPRPEVPRLVALYSEEQKRVLDVKPGITGPTQLFFRNEEELLSRAANPIDAYINQVMPRKLAIDLEYIQNRSLLSDFVLILKTPFAILRNNKRKGCPNENSRKKNPTKSAQP